MIAAKPISEVPSCAAASTAERRSRRFNRPVALYCASVMVVLAALGLLAFLGLAAMMLLTNDPSMGMWSLAAVAGFLFFTLMSVWQTGSLRCQLCHGKVLSDNGCLKHAQAQRLPLLTYRLTTALSVVFTLRFRCMYCGTRHRLWE